MSYYSTGTISVTNGSASVTGTGTAWSGAVFAGDTLIGPDGLTYVIASVESDTALTLTRSYAGTTASDAAYEIVYTQARNVSATSATTELYSRVDTMLEGAGKGKFPNGDASQPGVRSGEFQNVGIYFGDQLLGLTDGVRDTSLEDLTSGAKQDGRTFDTISDAVADTKLKASQSIFIAGRLYNLVPASTYPANGGTVINLTGSSLQAVLAPGEAVATAAAAYADTRPPAWFTLDDDASVFKSLDGFAYKPVSSGAWPQTAGLVRLKPVADASGYRHMRAFGVLADGTDETAKIQAAVATGVDLDWGGRLHTYGVSAMVAMAAGQKFKARGATLKALAQMETLLDRASDTEVRGLWLDANNTQPATGTPITQTGAKNAMQIADIMDTITERVRFTKYQAGARVVSTTAGVKCGNHDFINCRAEAGFEWEGDRSSNVQVGAYVGSVASPEELNFDNFTGNVNDECEDVFGITFKGWRAYEGQYGLALHRCSNSSVTGSFFRRMSRCISIQQQSRGITVQGNVLHDFDSTGVHMARGVQQVSVVGNRLRGTPQNDNVMIQAYYRVKDITIANNVLDSRFDLWDGGNTGEKRRPEHGIRIGQQAEDVTITGNVIRGFVRGIYVKSTVYEGAIQPTDQNYYNSGFRNITIRDNVIRAGYYTAETTYKTEMTTTQTYGVDLRISGSWEDTVQGGWNISGILLEGNRVYNAAFGYNVQTAATEAAAPPEFLSFSVPMRDNISTNAGQTDVSRATVANPIAVTFEGNSWPDEQDWTPTLVGDGTAGVQTYTYQIGGWVARGRRIHVRGRVVISAKDAGIAGSVVIGELPAAVKAGSQEDCAGAVSLWSNWSLTAGYTALGAQAEPGQSRLRLIKSGSGQAAGYVGSGEMDADAQINFACEYEAG